MRIKQLLSKEKWSETKLKLKLFSDKKLQTLTELASQLSELSGEEIIDKIHTFFSKQAQIAKAIKLGAVVGVAFFLADTVSLFTHYLIPDPPPVPAPKTLKKQEKQKNIEEYSSIISRNIFNSEGLIPEDGVIAGGAPRKTGLPLNLIGTVVLADELKSIAALEDRSQNLILPVRIDDTVDNKIHITKIERFKVYFINQSTGQLEYVEIVEDLPNISPESLNISPGIKTSIQNTGIKQSDDTHFDIERTAVDKALTNLHDVLQQARAIPNFENGMPDGYKLIQIVPNSIYDQIGLKNGDVLCGINGDSINDPSKAFQIFNELKTSNHLELCVKRAGKKTTMNYDIR